MHAWTPKMHHCRRLAHSSYVERKGNAARRRRTVYFVCCLLMAALLLLGSGSNPMYWFDDALLTDEALRHLIPDAWVAFRAHSRPHSDQAHWSDHPFFRAGGFLANNASSSATYQRDGVVDVKMLVARWSALGSVDRIDTPPAKEKRPRKAWNGIRGVFLEALGDGTVRWHDAAGGLGHYRLRKTVIRYVVDAIGRHVKKHLVFHLGIDDNDVFHVFRTYPDSQLTMMARQIIADYAEVLYFVHWNPTLVDDDLGVLGPRMIPIPDYEHIYVRTVEVTPARSELPRETSVRVFGWRGGTTGAFNDYKMSDRARVVTLFNHNATSELALISDVKFDGVGGESVRDGDIPPSHVGGSLTTAEMRRNFVFHLDIDGNANSWRGLRWKLASGSPVIKSKSRFVQWYYPLLQENTHLILWDIDDTENTFTAEWLLQLAHSVSDVYASEFAPMAERAGALASELFHRKAAEAVIYDSFASLSFFDSPRDWRVRRLRNA